MDAVTGCDLIPPPDLPPAEGNGTTIVTEEQLPTSAEEIMLLTTVEALAKQPASPAGEMGQRELALAEALARYAHYGQVDQAGVDYIEHPLAVAAQLDDPTAKVVALLHDVLEDSMITADQLRTLFGDAIADSVKAMTRQKGEDYNDYLHRLAMDPLATQVKLADLHHNMDLSRLASVTEKDRKRLGKYKEAETYLRSL